jgi:CRP-like cAMP-binding protein
MNWSVEKNESCPTCEFQQNLKILGEIYFFSVLPIETLKVFAYLCTRDTYKPGDYLFTQDEDDGQAYYLISGDAVLIRNENGTDKIIRNFSAGDFSGALTLLGHAPRLFSLKASTAVESLILSREKFTHALNQYPLLMSNVFHAVADKIQHWEAFFLAERSEECSSCRNKIGVSLI